MNFNSSTDEFRTGHPRWYVRRLSHGRIDPQVSVITLSYIYYSDGVGAYAGQNRDKRQFLSLNSGW
jgi:hypothetical protein